MNPELRCEYCVVGDGYVAWWDGITRPTENYADEPLEACLKAIQALRGAMRC